ncbi:MAG: nucleotidyl transferase AbiEii/AbiGii toxin family protein [Desulfohalobiaceae bacterium]
MPRVGLRSGKVVHSYMFEPNLEILPPAQRTLGEELATTPNHFVLYEGTALALRLGHRSSVDFDFFSSHPFSPADLQERIPYLRKEQRIQSEPNTLTCLVQRRGEPIKISFFGGLDLARVDRPQRTVNNGIWVASLLDLAATKLKVIQDRAEAKDYLDLARLLDVNIGLSDMIRAAMGVYGPAFNPMISMRALTFFQDGDLPELDPEIQKSLREAVSGIDLEALRPMPRIGGKLEGEEEA